MAAEGALELYKVCANIVQGEGMHFMMTILILIGNLI